MRLPIRSGPPAGERELGSNPFSPAAVTSGPFRSGVMLVTRPLPRGSCEKIPLTPALSPAFGEEGKGEGAI